MSEQKKATRKPCIKLAPHEKRMLEELYSRRRIPRDQYKKRPQELVALVEEWNKLSGRVDTPDDVIRYIINRQKNKDWVTFDGNHLSAPPSENLTADQVDILVQIYTEDVLVFGRGSDALASDAELRELISREFAARTNRIVPGYALAAILETMRKEGLLPLLGDMNAQQQKPSDDGDAFRDIGDADRRHSAAG